MEEGSQEQEIQYKKVVRRLIQNKKVVRRLMGKNFLLVQRIQFAAFAKQAGGVNRRGGDEAAAKDGYHEISDK